MAAGDSFLIYGLFGLLIGLIAAFFFFLQCCRPTLGVNVYTSRLSFCPCNWAVFMETYKVRGTGPGISIQDPDDVGHKLLNRSQPENVLSTHKGKDIPKQGISQELIITNRRVGFKRRKACCCKFVTLENSLWTYKLDEVANCHADSSFPLFFLIFCGFTAIVGLVAYLWNDARTKCRQSLHTPTSFDTETVQSESAPASSSCDSVQTLSQVLYTVGVIWVIYANLLNRLPGGIGCCRKSQIKVYFKSPSPMGCPALLTDFDAMELPPGVGAQTAVNICSEIMKAKAEFISKKTT